MSAAALMRNPVDATLRTPSLRRRAIARRHADEEARGTDEGASMSEPGGACVVRLRVDKRARSRCRLPSRR
uniref:Uncharacterized protein n=1 Tax=Arundo donax TaxID=35708 RepID=A0A0A9B3U8_ARUDO